MDCPMCGLNCGDTCYRPPNKPEGINTIKVNTFYNSDLVIQEVKGIDHSTMIRDILKLKEQGVREALIALGWTPPEGGDNG